MGCSRPGAVAIVSVFLAGALAMISLVLPYWSKMEIVTAAGEKIEIALGLWGACTSVHPPALDTLTAPVIANGSEVIAIEPESALSDSFTCGSFYDDERVRISCTSFRELANGQCKRREFRGPASLCDVATTASFLGDSTAVVPDATVSDWLSVVDNACHGIGHTAVALAVLSAISASLCGLLLFVGITCGAIESRLGRVGGYCAFATATLQLALAVLWTAEAHPIRYTEHAFATSFYLNAVSILLHAAAFVAAQRHQSLEKEALAAMDLDGGIHADGAATEDKEKAMGSSKATELVAV
ncbi:hypothetical protein ATCC90586_005234 [Pythium insidiosum]|nr:hypothetical protein ATCC90586_005234 [Pythium insidiosum]